MDHSDFEWFHWTFQHLSPAADITDTTLFPSLVLMIFIECFCAINSETNGFHARLVSRAGRHSEQRLWHVVARFVPTVSHAVVNTTIIAITAVTTLKSRFLEQLFS